jgi:putative Mn2+ efflux pump MntP
MCRKHIKLGQSLRIAISLAIFQGAMPVIGWFIGSSFSNVIEKADHWIAFVLLSILGIKMIKDGLVPVGQKKVKNPSSWKVLIPMSLATSIDAFAIGIGFSFFIDSIIFPALLITLVTFVVSLFGIYMGRKLGSNLAGKAEILGGIILIIIGTKILVEHLFFV